MTVKQMIKGFAPVRALQKARYRRLFLTADRSNLFSGVYLSLAQAVAAVPQNKPLGYDCSGAAALYAERHQRVYPADYPVLFWLDRIIGKGTQIFELGGHTGIAFDAYQQYLRYPSDLSWTILDVPKVCSAGQELASQSGEARLSFVTEPPAHSFHAVIASGSLQYLEGPLSQTLSALAVPPQHVLLNLLPVTELATYFTIQNMGPAYCPYKISNRTELIGDLATLGYELIDEWQNPEKSCVIPFADQCFSLNHYRGYYFRRATNSQS